MSDRVRRSRKEVRDSIDTHRSTACRLIYLPFLSFCLSPLNSIEMLCEERGRDTGREIEGERVRERVRERWREREGQRGREEGAKMSMEGDEV